MVLNLYFGVAEGSTLERRSFKGLDDFFKSYTNVTVSKIPEDKVSFKHFKRRRMIAGIFGEMTKPVRKNDNLITRSVIPLDLDYVSPEYADRTVLSQALTKILGCEFYIFPSISYGRPDKGARYHVYIPLSEPLRRKEYEQAVTYLNSLLKRSKVITQMDKSNRTWAQLNGLPILTQYMPEEFEQNLVKHVSGAVLDVQKLTGAIYKVKAQKAARSSQTASRAEIRYADSMVEQGKALDVIRAYAQRNQDWLSTYANFLGAYYELKHAENQHQLSHEQALEAVRILANGNNEWANENVKKYEHDNAIQGGGKGLAFFTSTTDIAAQHSWLVKTEHGGIKIDVPELAEEIMTEFPAVYNKGALPTGGAIWQNGRWNENNFDAIVRHIADKKLKSAGVWNARTVPDVLRYVTDNTPAVFWQRNKFDESNTNLIEFDNCTLNLETMELSENKPDNYIPVHFGYDWNADFNNPKLISGHWQAMIQELVGGDKVAATTIYRAIGYIYQRSYSHQIIMIFKGDGENGKSTLMNMVRDLIVGPDHVAGVSLSMIANDNNRFASSQLYHKSLNEFSDISSNYLQSTAMAKSLSGNDAQNAEYKNKMPFTFRNFALLWFTGNNLPSFKDDSKGFARRPRVIDFPLNFKDEATAEHFRTAYPKDALKNEAQAFRQFCITEYQKHMHEPDAECFPESPAMTNTKNEWLKDADPTSAFLYDMLTFNPVLKQQDYGESTRFLYQIYQDWADDAGAKRLTKQNFEKKIKKYFSKTIVKRTRYKDVRAQRFMGVTLSTNGFDILDDLVNHQFDGARMKQLVCFDAWKEAR